MKGTRLALLATLLGAGLSLASEDPKKLRPGVFLYAAPGMGDPNFAETVVLLVAYDKTGAMGFVVNRPTETRAAEAVAMDPPLAGDSGMHLWTGGPVERHRGFLLLGDDPGHGESEQITDGFHLTASLDVAGLGGAVTFDSIGALHVPPGGASRQITVTVIWQVPATEQPGSTAGNLGMASKLEMTYGMSVVDLQSGKWYVKEIGASTEAVGAQ
jgi:putative transcriptional regulator